MDIKQEIESQEDLIYDLKEELEFIKTELSEADSEDEVEAIEDKIIAAELRLSEEQDILTELKKD